MGAHPWRAVKAGIIGSGIGALIWLALRWTRLSSGLTLWLGSAGLVASVASAVIGKRVFAASLAESALAGRFWLFGWFGVFACLAFVLIKLLRSVRR